MISGPEPMQPRQAFLKTRLAPTPSGYLHLGNIVSFAITLALARQSGAKVLLRIDDMDRDRAMPTFVRDVFDTLRFLEMPWEEGPAGPEDFEANFSQRHRMPLYEEALQHLAREGHVFACTCSRTQVLQQSPDGAYPGTCQKKGLPLDTPNAAWRLQTPDQVSMRLHSLSGIRHAGGLPPAVQHFVVRKKDGAPAYQLCSVVDDLYFGVDLIVRGADLWPSTLAQWYLSTLLPQNSFVHRTFFHHPLVHDGSGKKLSKSAGSTSIHYLRQEGKTRADVFTLLGRLLQIHNPVADWHALGTALLALPAFAKAEPC